MQMHIQIVNKLANIILEKIKENYGLLFSIVFLCVLLLLRINSQKYSYDTAARFDQFRNILFNHTFYLSLIDQHLFGFHFSPFFAVISPAYFFKTSGMIFFWKFICYASFLFIFWFLIIDRKYPNVPAISSNHKNLFLLVVFLHPAFISNLINPNIWDSEFVLPFLALSFFTFYNKKYLTSIFMIFITFLIKEDMYLLGIMYGIFVALSTKRLIYLWFSVLSGMLFFVVTHFIMPQYSTSPEGLNLLAFSYGDLGSNLDEVIINIIKNPLLILTNGLWLRKSMSVFIIFSCVGFLPFFKLSSSLILIPALGVIGYTAIAKESYLDFSKHYMIAVSAFVYFAAYNSYTKIDSQLRNKVMSFSVIASLVVILILQIYIRNWSYYLYSPGNIENVEDAAKQIPHNSSLLTHGVGSPWMCYNMNCKLSSFFSPTEIEHLQSDYILINLRTVFWEILKCNEETALMKGNLKILYLNINYRVIYYKNDVVLLNRYTSDKNLSKINWFDQITQYEKNSQDCMKPAILRSLRFY